MSVKKVVQAIKKHKSFLISAHVDLEGDALGSEIALAYLLKKLKKKAFIVNQDGVPECYKFLPGRNMIVKGRNIPFFDTALIVDCSDLRRIGKVKGSIAEDKFIINIDHHLSNEKFGHVNWVDDKASSASEMIYRLYKEFNLSVPKEAALALYAGISTDTGFFKYSNTRALTLKITSELLNHGFDSYKVYKTIYQNIPLADMRSVADIISGFKTDGANKIAWVSISKKAGEGILKGELTDMIFGFLRSIKDIEVAVIFREKGKAVTKVNLRAQGKVNVGKLAVSFGGGGHKNASGFSLNKNIITARKLVLSKIKNLI